MSIFLELDKKFERQIELDNKTYPELIDEPSEYMKNPEVSENPDFLLIGMEPTKKEKERIDSSIRNFVSSVDDIIIHYCAYKYLCNENFNYYITDISKGAMPVGIAERNRKKRYDVWLNLLKDEVKILGDPLPIAIGKVLVETLNRSEHFNNLDFIPHYSNSNNGSKKEYYENFVSKKYSLKDAPSTKEIFNFANKLFNHLNYSYKTKELLDKIEKGLSDSKKRLILCYQYKFEEIINSMNS